MKIYSGNKFHIKCYLQEPNPIKEDCIVFTCKSNGILTPLFAKILGLSTARYWTGNDAWKYLNVWHYWLRAKIINLFFDKHYFIASHMQVLTGEVRTITTPLMRAERKEKEPCIHFRVAYYEAEGSYVDRYGLNMIERLMEIFPDFKWIAIKPNQYSESEMYELYHNLDLYIRPSTWDGDPFMVREALHFGVPTISTFSSDKFNIQLSPNNIEHWIREIKYIYKDWKIEMMEK